MRAAIDAREWPAQDLVQPHLRAKRGFAEVDDDQPHVGWTLDRALEYHLKTVNEQKKGYQQGARPGGDLWKGR